MKLLHIIKKDIDLVYEHLSDMKKFVLVHPLIFQIDDLKDGNYLVHEKLKFGFIPLIFTYPVSIEKNNLNRNITIRATVIKMSKIEMEFKLNSDKAYTFVEESISVRSPFPIQFIVNGVFKKQHAQLFKNIEMI